MMETSCGIVLSNMGAILLLQYPQGHWDFPKGHLEDADADRKSAAARELEEETGIADINFIDGFEDRTEYNFKVKGKRIDKEVWWYVAETESMSIRLSHEHRNWIWLEWDEAEQQLTHEESRKVLRAAREHMTRAGR